MREVASREQMEIKEGGNPSAASREGIIVNPRTRVSSRVKVTAMPVEAGT